MSRPLAVLIVEDSESDAELIAHFLTKAGYSLTCERVDSAAQMRAALEKQAWGIVISDFNMPGMDGFTALTVLQETGLDIPFIVVSGTMGEETAVDMMKAGAHDYVMKGNLARLVPAVERELSQVEVRLERKQAEEKQAQTYELLTNLARQVPGVIYQYRLYPDGSSAFPYSSPGMYSIYEVTPEQVREDATPVFGRLHPEDADRVSDLIFESARTLEEIYCEFRVILPEQGLRWRWSQAHPERTADGGTIWHGIISDITERKQAQAKIQLQAAALEAAANGIVITDRDGAIEWANPAFTTLTGYTSSEVQGKNPRELIKSGRHERTFYQQLWDTILAGEVWQGELVNRRKDGSLYPEEQTITPLLDAAGRITHFIGIKQDITARKQSEATLLQYAIRQEKMAELGRALAAEFDLYVIYRTAEDHIRSMIDCPNFAFTLFDPQQEILKAAYVSSDGGLIDVNTIPPLQFDLQHSSSGRSKAITSQSPEIVLDMETKRKAGGGLLLGSELEPLSAIYVPMLAEGQVIGLMELQSYQDGAYTTKDGEWLSVAANQIGMSIQNARLFARAQQRIAELSALAIIDSAVTSHLAPQATYEILLEQVTTQLRVDAAVLFLFNPQSQELECVLQRGYLHTRNLQIRLRLGESLAGQVALEKRMVHIKHLSSKNAHLLKDQSISEGFEDYYGVPLLVEGEIIGVLEALQRSQLNPDSDWLRFLEMLAGQSAIVISTLRLYEDVQRGNVELLKAYDATIEGWSQAMDLRDRETEGHTQRVTEMTIQLATEIGIAEELLIQLRRGALHHDIGKLGVPDSILRKHDALSDDEWVLMKKHPEYAYHMLEAIEYLRPALDIPYCHHEKWDGSGYPRGLTGNEIPLAARLFAIIDVWDALTSDRPYRKAWTKEAVLQHISDQSDKHFDPQVVEAFTRLYKKNPHALGFFA